MPLPMSAVLRPVFRLSAEAFPKLAAERFGAQDDMDKTWQTFEPVARTLVDSFYATIDDCRHEAMTARLEAVDPELRGIAYEGAGMGLMLLDSLFPYKKRLPAFIHGPGASYRCLVYIGAGLVLPRVPVNPARFLAKQDPFLRWLVMDGYGFYQGFFAWEKHGRDVSQVPRSVCAATRRRGFDQGVGRSLWFSTGANVERIIATTRRVSRPPARPTCGAVSGWPVPTPPASWTGRDRDPPRRGRSRPPADLAVGSRRSPRSSASSPGWPRPTPISPAR